MSKPIIGIIAPRYEENDRPFKNYTKLIDNYSKRIIASDGIPIGLTFPEGKFTDTTLSICDGLVFQGAGVLDASYLDALHYAIKNNIPVLAICAGMQAMAGYEYLIDKNPNLNYDDIDEFFKTSSEDEFLTKVKDHNQVPEFYFSEIDNAKHPVYLKENSKIYDIYKQKILLEPSIHNYKTNDEIFTNVEGKYFQITGIANDNTIEVLESKAPNLWIIGVQFHPELEDFNQILFDALIKEANKRKLEK